MAPALKNTRSVTDDLGGGMLNPSRSMTNTKITVNGRRYDSPEAMPPDVRRTYEEALRMMASASGQPGGNTQVFTGQTGHVGASVVVNRVITVNDRTYGNIDEMPPDMRKLYEAARTSASGQATHQPRTGVHVSIDLTGPKVRTFDDSSRSPAPAPLPIDSSTEARIRGIPESLAVLVAIGLVLWFLLGR
jgi:hypothetical protein